MKSERLVVLLSKEEKARIVEMAEAQHTSVGELVRSALSNYNGTAFRPKGFADAVSAEIGTEARDDSEPDAEPNLSADQVAALERLADVTMQSMERANAALDKAFAEIETTKAHFAAKRRERRTHR